MAAAKVPFHDADKAFCLQGTILQATESSEIAGKKMARLMAGLLPDGSTAGAARSITP